LRYAGAFGGACLALALAGCDLAPRYHVPLTQVPVGYKEASVWQQARPADAVPRGEWWRSFGDLTLNALEAQVDSGNPTLASELAAFQQARAFAAQAYAGLYPTLSVGSQITTNRQSARRPLRSAHQPNQYLDNSIDAQASYEVDLWDRVANAVKSGRAAAQAAAADLASVRLSLHAELAGDYVALRGFDAQAEVLGRAVRAFEQVLSLTQARFAGKISSGLDVARAQTQLDAAQAALTDNESQRALLEHAIAVLIGKPPAELTVPPDQWRLAQPAIPVGLPSTLLERRPDIASAERLVAAANANIGVARAAFYPTLSLNMIYGLQDTGFNLFSLPNDFWTVGPGLAMPLFEGGLRDAEEAAAIAAWRRAAADYRQTVLAAFQQVEDAASQIRLLGEEARQEEAAVTAARHTVDMSMALYRDGAASFLEVVIAEADELRSEQAAADLRTRQTEACVQLIRALGGGWTRGDLPALKRLMWAGAGRR
jgi:NodT family efflux transporter outer membrane factor (OMF) lipoprotein